MSELTLVVLEEGRAREKEQTLFYRGLAAEAELGGREDLSERFNALHADEQHHLSRLTARVLELGGTPKDLAPEPIRVPGEDRWEAEARAREESEVAWYTQALTRDLDPATREVLQEILESEEHHARELGGKWISA